MKALKQFFREHGMLVKKLSITIVMPMVLALTGALIISVSAWNFLSQAYLVGTTIFNRPTVELNARTYNINGQDVVRPQLGERFATLNIPAVELERPIIHGDSPAELRRGVGHFAGSTLPGERGNVILDGHRDTMLYPLKDIQVNDEILIETAYGTYKYRVSEIVIVPADAKGVLQTADYEKLTLYTCYPFNYIGNSPERFIVTADFVDVL